MECCTEKIADLESISRQSVQQTLRKGLTGEEYEDLIVVVKNRKEMEIYYKNKK